MPIIDDQINPGLLQLLAQQNSQSHQDRMMQIDNLIKTAHAGQTVGELGITPKRFAAMFGKDVPYDPNKQIVDEKATDVTDTLVKKWIKGLDPVQAMDLAASLTQNRAGVAGFTTSRGVTDQMTTGGSRDTVAKDIALKTAPDQITAGTANASASAKNAQAADVQAGTHLDTMKEVAGRVNAGFDSMRKAAPAAQDALNQTLAFGQTATGLQSKSMEDQLKIASVKEALAAQVDPRHPMNAFLAKNGLDIHTTMGAAAMGVQNLLDNYSRGLMQLKVGNKEAENIILRAKVDYAKDMSEKVFMGRVTPNQVMTITDAQENGKGIPKGYEGVAAIINQATEANYNAAVADAIQKGDPIAMAAQHSITNFEKLGKDPRQLEAANQISRLSAAHLMTKLQTRVDKPDEKADPEGAAAWTRVYDSNLKRIIGAKVNINWIHPNSYDVTGTPTTDVNGQLPNQPVLPVKPISGVPAASGILSGFGGVGGQPPAPSVGNVNLGASAAKAPSAADLTVEQKAAIDQWMSAYGAGQPVAPKP